MCLRRAVRQAGADEQQNERFFDRSVLGGGNHPMPSVQPTMIELLMIVVRWLAGFGFGGEVAAGSASFVARVGRSAITRGSGRAIGAFPGIGWMTVRLDSLSSMRVLSGSSSVWRGPAAWCTTPRCGGVSALLSASVPFLDVGRRRSAGRHLAPPTTAIGDGPHLCRPAEDTQKLRSGA